MRRRPLLAPAVPTGAHAGLSLHRPAPEPQHGRELLRSACRGGGPGDTPRHAERPARRCAP
eukprot:8586687-Pyramimonas_sp.AAC.1